MGFCSLQEIYNFKEYMFVRMLNTVTVWLHTFVQVTAVKHRSRLLFYRRGIGNILRKNDIYP